MTIILGKPCKYHSQKEYCLRYVRTNGKIGDCIEAAKTRVRNWEKANREKVNTRCRAWYARNRVRHRLTCLKWEKAHPQIRKDRELKRRQNDIQFRLTGNLRARLNCAIKNNQKIGSAIDDLGCSIEELKQHLESQFQSGMTWENYGKQPGQWSMDHIIPLSVFDLTDRQQFLEAAHYSNLRPMWHCGVDGNISKGTKILPKYKDRGMPI